jgi:hypothetical protein
MRIISHRGNIYGPDPSTENSPETIVDAIINGYDVEIDLWVIDEVLLLGHDEPTYEITPDWLSKYNKYLWIHCKNISALNLVKNNYNAFGHDIDDYILTSKLFIWVYPNKPLVANSIAVLPETTTYNLDNLNHCYGICTDFAYKYKMEFNK